MSFLEVSDAFVWECDDCGLQAIFPPSDFYGRKDELKERGWLFRLDEETGHEGYGRHWTHYCQRCSWKKRKPLDLSRPFHSIKGSGG
jgi:hypothetical protein